MAADSEKLPEYKVNARDREPLIQFIVDALEGSGCRILHRPKPNLAPFRFTFETREGERMGIVAYAFFANTKETTNRPDDEHRFQVKYGPRTAEPHTLWHDPHGLYTTLFFGINVAGGFFVAADPWLHNITKFFISIEFKQRHVERILADGWHAWERARKKKKDGHSEPAEVLVGGTAEHFLRYVRFEREAFREDQGHRQLLAERAPSAMVTLASPSALVALPAPHRLHALAEEFEMNEAEVLDLIDRQRHLRMAVRGGVAEMHLVRTLSKVDGVTECNQSQVAGDADVQLRFRGSRVIKVECKNVLREKRAGLIRVDFQRTRASKADPCSRYYSPKDFDVVAACVHAVTERWEFQYARTTDLAPHTKCEGKLSHLVKLDDAWAHSVQEVLRAVVNR